MVFDILSFGFVALVQPLGFAHWKLHGKQKESVLSFMIARVSSLEAIMKSISKNAKKVQEHMQEDVPSCFQGLMEETKMETHIS